MEQDRTIGKTREILVKDNMLMFRRSITKVLFQPCPILAQSRNVFSSPRANEILNKPLKIEA
jgi:hypothetical protein